MSSAALDGMQTRGFRLRSQTIQLIYLTQDEIREITGYRRRKQQFAWLIENGFTVKARADGSPLVARSNYHTVMGGIAGAEARRIRVDGPDLDALKHHAEEKICP